MRLDRFTTLAQEALSQAQASATTPLPEFNQIDIRPELGNEDDINIPAFLRHRV